MVIYTHNHGAKDIGQRSCPTWAGRSGCQVFVGANTHGSSYGVINPVQLTLWTNGKQEGA